MTNYGEDETPSADMATDEPLRPGAFGWTTYAERLQEAGSAGKSIRNTTITATTCCPIFPAFRPCDQGFGPLSRAAARG